MTGQRGHEPLTCRNLRQIPLQKAVALRHVNVFTAGFLCFRRLPAASLQLGILVRTRNHFPGLYCGNAHSLRPRKTTFSINLDQGGCHLQWKDSGRAYANPELGMGIQWQILARQKADMGIHSHPIVWRRPTTKGSARLWQKNVSGKMKRSGAGDKRWTQKLYLGKQNKVVVDTEWKWLRKTEERWEKAWNYCVDKRNRGAKQNKAAGEGLELVRGTKESQYRGHRQEYKKIVRKSRFEKGWD